VYRLIHAAIAALCVSSCLGRSTFILGTLADSGDANTHNAGDPASPMPWGQWAATQNLPDCPAGSPELLVTTTTDELEGGTTLADPANAGSFLSLVEALTIAANRAGPDTILFDEAVFAPDSDASILFDGDPSLPNTSAVCIDARNRHVHLRFSETCGNRCMATFSGGSLLLGLEIDAHVGGDNKWFLNASQAAGCLLTADAFSAGAFMLMGTGSVVGPGNYFKSGPFNNNESGVVTDGLFCTAPVVRDNYFGYDPRTARAEGFGSIGTGVLVWVPMTITGNVFAGLTDPLWFGALSEAGDVVFSENWVGVDKAGNPTLPCGLKGPLSNQGRLIIGPNNVIAHNDLGVEIRSNAYPVRVTHNSIYANQTAGISYLTGWAGEGPTPPTLTAVTTTRVTGSCAEAGDVELFADDGNQGQTFLATTPCTVGVDFSLSVIPPSGRNLTATVTNAVGYTSRFSSPWAVP